MIVKQHTTVIPTPKIPHIVLNIKTKINTIILITELKLKINSIIFVTKLLLKNLFIAGRLLFLTRYVDIAAQISNINPGKKQ